MTQNTVPLGNVVEMKVPQGRPTRGEFTYVDISSIDNESKQVVDPKRLPAARAPSRARQHLRAKDVVVSMTRPNLNAVALITEDLEGSIGSTGFDVLRAADGARAEWIYYAVQSPQFVLAMCKLVQGALYPAVRPKDIRAFCIPLPSLDEQQRAVAEIEKQFTRLDAGVASLKQVQTALKRYRASVLKAACEGRLVPTEAELARAENRSYETGDQLLHRILKEQREKWADKGKYKEPIAPNVVDLPELPAGWTWATVQQLAASEARSITDGPFGSNLKTEHYTNAGPRVIRLQNIGDGVFLDEEAHISEAHFQRLQKHRVFAGDLVIAAFGANPPRSCVVPPRVGAAIVKADCIRFKPHRAIATKYMNVALNSDPVRRRTQGMVHGVGRPRLNLAEIKSIRLPVPPLAEQERIVLEAERRLSVIEELEAVTSVELQRATRLRQSILHSAFSGT